MPIDKLSANAFATGAVANSLGYTPLSATAPSAIANSSANVISFAANGNIGIGTNTPESYGPSGSKLAVVSTATGSHTELSIINNPNTTYQGAGILLGSLSAAANVGATYLYHTQFNNGGGTNANSYSFNISQRKTDGTYIANIYNVDYQNNVHTWYAPNSGNQIFQVDSSGNVVNASGRIILRPSGSILQVVSTIKTDTFSTSSTGDTAITGLSVSITPTSTSSRIFIMYSVNYDSTRGNSGGGFRIYRNGSHLTGASGASAGSRYTVNADFGANANADQSGMHRTGQIVDSPATTSALTYAMYTSHDSGFSTHINRARADGNEGDDGRFASTITVFEIAG